MKNKILIDRLRGVVLMAGALMVFSGCAPKELPPFYWPLPPAPPKLQYVGNYATLKDMKQTGVQALAAGISGESEVKAIHQPTGIAGDSRGKVYVAMPVDSTVKVFDFNARTIEDFPAKVVRPFSVSVDSAGLVYIGDFSTKRVLVFSPEGEPIRSFGGEELIGKPIRIELNEQLGRVYVADSMNNRIEVFDMAGNHLFTIGKAGGGDGEFNNPQGLAFDSAGKLYVADTLNARVQVFDADGNFLAKWGERGSNLGYFESIKDLAFTKDDVLWLVDQRKNTLYGFSTEGRFLFWLNQGGPSVSPFGFAGPNTLWIDADEKIHVAELFNHRFSVWQYVTEDYLREHPVPAGWLKGEYELQTTDDKVKK